MERNPVWETVDRRHWRSPTVLLWREQRPAIRVVGSIGAII